MEESSTHLGGDPRNEQTVSQQAAPLQSEAADAGGKLAFGFPDVGLYSGGSRASLGAQGSGLGARGRRVCPFRGQARDVDTLGFLAKSMTGDARRVEDDAGRRHG